MAQLYQDSVGGDPAKPRHLPTLAESKTAVRDSVSRRQALQQLHLVTTPPRPSADSAATAGASAGVGAGARAVAGAGDIVATASAALGSSDGPTSEQLEALNQALLQQLACSSPPQFAAYQLGRAMRDTCWLPGRAAGAAHFLRQFSRSRVATLQGWLAQAGATLPPGSADVVSRSLARWQVWSDVNARHLPLRWESQSGRVVNALRQQSHGWWGLLAGEIEVPASPGTDAWILAGQSLLTAGAGLTRQVVRRFWYLAIVVVAAVAALVVLALHNTKGTTSVWTSLVTVAGGLGLTGAGLRAGARKAAGTFEVAIEDTARKDAQAWQVTWLPVIPQGPWRRFRLSQQGITSPKTGRRLEGKATASK